MDSPKYLIIVTLIEGQNFTVPEGAPDKLDATVFAEARFGNESILKSDPIKLTNSFPEFVTELAWQLDKKSLHQLRVERRSIKLQIFLQTRERKRQKQTDNQKLANGTQSSNTSNDATNSTHKIELIGYTVIDIRSAQERGSPKFQWLPLLNPKFRKSSYNRPEIQLALTLTRIDDDTNVAGGDAKLLPSTSLLAKRNDSDTTTTTLSPTLQANKQDSSLDYQSHESHESEVDSLADNSKLYKTCLDFSLDSSHLEEKDEIIENDINIRCKDGCHYIYDRRDACKSSIDDCDEKYRISVTIPFNSDLPALVAKPSDDYYFTVSLFGSSKNSSHFKDINRIDTQVVEFDVFTTHSSILATYFELNSGLIIKLQDATGLPLGIGTIQLDQLCSLDTKYRSIEGVFALESIQEQEIPPSVHPTIGVSVVLKKLDDIDNEVNEAQSLKGHKQQQENRLISSNHIELAKEHFGEDIDDYLCKTLNDTHQLTLESSDSQILGSGATLTNLPGVEDGDDDLKHDDHHFCFTIDLKSFSYTPAQRLIPTLRELVVRYSYPFFGYKDTITTDASIPISPTNSIIVSGFCEFNFATSVNSLLTALQEIPLNLEILTCDEIKKIELDAEYTECVVATSSLNLAQTMNLDEKNLWKLKENSVNTTVSVPIYETSGMEVGELQIYLCLKDLGRPNYNIKVSNENLNSNISKVEHELVPKSPAVVNIEAQMVDSFIKEAKRNLESWKEEYSQKLSEEVRQRESEKFRRLYHRMEAREAKREQEFKKKIEELSDLEKRFKTSLVYIESLEKRLANNFDQLKSKDALLDNRLDTVDLMISKAVNNIKLEYEKRLNSLPVPKQRSLDENCLTTATNTRANSNQQQSTTSSRPLVAKPVEVNPYRRSSLKNSNTSPGIPISVRSSSLVRGPYSSNNNNTEGQSTTTLTRLIKRPTNVTATVINGTSTTSTTTTSTSSSRLRATSTRLHLSKETQEKLTSLRREKAELLKRGCRPNDELIQEINMMIEKLGV